MTFYSILNVTIIVECLLVVGSMVLDRLGVRNKYYGDPE